MTTAADDAARRERIRRTVKTWPPLSPDDLAAIAAAVAPGWVLEDARSRPSKGKGKAKP